ncbi:hypothetical protein ACHAWF_018650 [Thalassiosira exigua]
MASTPVISARSRRLRPAAAVILATAGSELAQLRHEVKHADNILRQEIPTVFSSIYAISKPVKVLGCLHWQRWDLLRKVEHDLAHTHCENSYLDAKERGLNISLERWVDYYNTEAPSRDPRPILNLSTVKQRKAKGNQSVSSMSISPPCANHRWSKYMYFQRMLNGRKHGVSQCVPRSDKRRSHLPVRDRNLILGELCIQMAVLFFDFYRPMDIDLPNKFPHFRFGITASQDSLLPSMKIEPTFGTTANGPTKSATGMM